MSSLTWLDSSTAEQKRMREHIALFTERESRDELGLGTIRDTFSNALFPGTSTLHTRARYFLLVPWMFRYHAERDRAGADLWARAETTERRLIEWMRTEGLTEGLIGRVAGRNVVTLGSAIYWSGLREFGILREDVAPDQLTARTTGTWDVDELESRQRTEWSPTLPPAPQGFPSGLPGGLDLTEDEASWLAEHIVTARRGTLLAHLVAHRTLPDGSSAPWEDPACRDISPEVDTLLQHAEGFSRAMRGATLLYALLVAERYEAMGFTREEDVLDRSVKAWQDWTAEAGLLADALGASSRDAFWAEVYGRNARVPQRTRSFVDAWLDAVQDGRAAQADPHHDLRQLVEQRERRLKGPQSRLTNDRLLGLWGGSGGLRFVYRWPQVQRLLGDLDAGRHHAGA